MAAQADRHWATLASHALRQSPEEVGGRWELARRRGAELELGAGEVSRSRGPPRRERGSHRAVALAGHAVAWDTRHGVDIATDGDAAGVLPGDVRSVMPGVGVLIRHDRPPIFDRQLALPRRHGRALALERLDLTTLAHAPEPVVVTHLRNAVLVAEVWGLER